MKRKMPKVGSLLRISVQEGYCFARVLNNLQIAVYELFISRGCAIELEDVYQSRVIFKMTVMKSALVSGRWETIDCRDLDPILSAPIEYFTYDKITKRYSIYNSADGSLRPSTYEECKSLEAAAVWDFVHVEDRIRDHFNGVDNAWAEDVRVKD